MPVASPFIAITRGITNAYSFSMNQAITTAKLLNSPLDFPFLHFVVESLSVF